MLHSVARSVLLPVYCRSQLLLWPTFKLSSFARVSSSVLRDLVFVSLVDTGYAHLSHRTFPLKTSVQTSNELSKISSTVSGIQGEGGTRESPEACDGDVCPSQEVVCWTKLPAFLWSYSPKVWF